jgi:hypothetical protein
VELVERASYWGTGAVTSNYMQFPLPKGGNGTGAVPKSNPNGHAGALLVSAFDIGWIPANGSQQQRPGIRHRY